MPTLLNRIRGLFSNRLPNSLLRRLSGSGGGCRAISRIESLETRQLLAATLIQDFTPGTIQIGPGLVADTYYRGKQSVVWNDSLYYFSDTSLYRSGSGGIEEVFNFAPGEDYTTTSWLTPIGNKLFFGAMSVSGNRLWVSDGTTGGTFPLRDLENDCRRPEFLTEFNGNLLFIGENATTGYELWTSDGTSAGTQPLLDLIPGPDFAYIEQITVIGETIFFAASIPGVGREVWRTDGTEAGTQIVLDVAPGAASSFPRKLTAVGDRLYFVATIPGNDPQLWMSDSITGETVPVLDGLSNPVLNPDSLSVLGTALVFTTGGENGVELWRADGAMAAEVADIQPGSGGSNPGGLVGLGNKVFFAADDGISGRELWCSDGTTQGTQLVADLNPGGSSNPEHLAASGNLLFFAASDNDHGTEVWRSDGTQSGTILLDDVAPGPDSGFDPTIGMKTGSTTAYFTATDGISGIQILRSTGSPDDTQMVTDPVLLPLSSDLAEFTEVDGTLYFFELGETTRLWKSDGTSAGTSLVKDIPTRPFEFATSLTRLGSNLIFLGPSPTEGFALWISDGTSAGTDILRDINPSGSIGMTAFTEFQGSLYFNATDPELGAGLWRTDGTESGTQLVADVDLTSGEYPPFQMYPAGDQLFFTADDGVHGSELWKTDGTPAGTMLVKDILPGSDGSMFYTFATAFNSRLYFEANDGVHGPELWTSDGTSAGTYMVQDINPGPVGSEPGPLRVVNGQLLFFANDGTHGTEFWNSDGTTAGTGLIRDIRPGAASSNDRFALSPVVFDDDTKICFEANDGTHGLEPWISDGTLAGTKLLRDIFPGPRGSQVSLRTSVGNLFHLYANDGVSGGELWQSDGSTEGTQLTVDLRPGLAPSGIYEVLPINNSLFFTGFSPVGYELFSVPINQRPSALNIDRSWVFENEPIGTSVGQLLVTDPDSANQATFSLASGPGDSHNELFVIDGHVLRTAVSFDFEQQQSYSVRVRATDPDGQYLEMPLSIQIIDVNDPPTLNQPADITVLENSPPLSIPLKGISAGFGENQPLQIAATSSNTSLISQPELNFESGSDEGSLVLNLTAQKTGQSTITVTVTDGGFDGDLATAEDNGSLVRTFVVNVASARPVFTGPLVSTFLQRPLLTFTAVPTAQSYQVWIGNRSTGQLPLLQATTVEPQYQVPFNLGIGRFDTYVRAELPGNQFGPWSLLNRFNINTHAEIAPIAARQITSRPTFNVTPQLGATTYEFWLDNRSTGQAPFLRVTLNRSTWTLDQDLPMSSYTLWARGIAADGTRGGWSRQRDFIVAAAPQLLSPLSSTFSRTPAFSWTAVAGASSYQISVRSANTGQVVASATGLTATSWTPATPLPDGPYSWQVVADSTIAGFRSDWTARILFNAGGRPIAAAPTGVVGITRPTLRWNAVESATSYEAWVNRIYENGAHAKVFSIAGLTSNQLQIPVALTDNASYRFWIRAVSSSGEVSSWSLPLDFSVRIAQSPPEPPLPINVLAMQFTLWEPILTPNENRKTLAGSESRTPESDNRTVPTDAVVAEPIHTDGTAIDESINAVVHWLQSPQFPSPAQAQSKYL